MRSGLVGVICLAALAVGCADTKSVEKTVAASSKPDAKVETKTDAKPLETVKAAVGSDAAPAKPTQAVEAPATTSWHGAGGVDTNAFYAAGPDWNIHYTAQDAGNAGAVFQIYVQRADSGRMLALAVDTRGAGEGKTSVRSAPGSYYLRVKASSPWTIEVTDLR